MIVRDIRFMSRPTTRFLSVCVALLGLSRVITAQSTLAPTSPPACDCDTNATVLQEVILCAANAFDAAPCGVDGNVSANCPAYFHSRTSTPHSHRLEQEPHATTYPNMDYLGLNRSLALL